MSVLVDKGTKQDRHTIRLSQDVLDGLLDCFQITHVSKTLWKYSHPNIISELTAVDLIGLLVGDLNAEFL